METITNWLIWFTLFFGVVNGLILAAQVMTKTGSERQRIRSLGTCVCMILYAFFMSQEMPVWGMLASLTTMVLNVATFLFPDDPVRTDMADRSDRGETVSGSALDGVEEIAALEAPALAEPLRIAVSRIESFRLVSGDALDPETATVSAMIDDRIPSLLSQYLSSRDVANDEERRGMATTALEAIIDIGEAAERHRAAAIARRRDVMTTEARFISERLGTDDAGRLTSLS